MKKGWSGFIVVLVLVTTSFAVQAVGVPHTINYQGYLTDTGGTPLTGTHGMVFSLCDAVSGGSCPWTETQNVSANKGIFSVVVGAVTPVAPLCHDPGHGETGHQASEILFVDPSVRDYWILLNGLRKGVEVVMLDAGRDGIEQIAETLRGRHDISAIHIISHGAPGEVFLGTGALSSENLDKNYSAMRSISRSLRKGGDILLYGCDVAQGETGKRFVQKLAAVTRANIAASTNLTGSANLGGDWVLESKTGVITETSAITDGVRYEGVLATPKVLNPSGPIYVRPGGTSYTWTYGTGWFPPTNGTAAITDISYHEVNWNPAGPTPGPEDFVLTLGKLQYSTNGGSTWSDYAVGAFVPNVNTFNTNFVFVSGKIWRFVHNNASNTTGSNTLGYAYFVSGYGSSIGTSDSIYPDNAPTDITSDNSAMFSDVTPGTTVATLTPADDGMTTGGYWTIDSQSVANLFTISFDAAAGNTATLMIGSGVIPGGGQTPTVTVRYYDAYQTDSSGNPIAGQGFAKTLTFTVRSETSADLNFSNDITVNTFTTNDQGYPSTAMLSNGNYVIVWQSVGQGGEDTSNHGIYGQIFSSTGTKVGSEFAVTSAGNGIDEINPRVAALNNSRFVVTYASSGVSGGSGYDVAFRIIEANGTVGSEIRANSTTTDDQLAPAITTLTDGSFMIVWMDWYGAVTARQFNASNGSAVGSEISIDSTGYNPDIAAISTGSYVVGWADYNTGEIKVKIGAAGSTISTGIMSPYWDAPRITGLSNGFVVVSESQVDSSTQIDGRRYNNSGVLQGSTLRINAGTSGNRYTPSIATLSGGGFIVVWYADTGDYSLGGVFGRRFNADGSAFDASDFEMNQHRRGDQFYPSVTAIPNNLFAAAWTDSPTNYGTGDVETRVLLPTAPTVTDANISISGASGTGGAYKIGDTVTATWNNTAGGDNNSGITGVTVDFSQFGGGAAVAATNSSGTWTATYTIASGAIDGTNKNVSVTATSGTATTTADTTNATLDNVAPTVTDARISISGSSGTGGAFKIGDTVTATWNNTAGGDNNADTISGVTMDFSQFGGGSAVAASNSSGTWTATYAIVSGAIDGTNKNVSVTATDNAGNTRTTADTTNAIVDNIAPTVTDAKISISGATGTGGAYKIGDTVTATWNNTAGGDNNSDTISSVTVDFSQFGGGSAVAATNSGGTWTATHTITAGAIDGTNRNISVTATDNAGNTTSTADTTNATVDNIAPTVNDARISISGATGTDGAYKIGDTVTATWNNTAGGDNNSDAISGVTVDFNQFGGGAAVAATNSSGTWTSTYNIAAGAINSVTNRNVSVTATDNAGNTTTTADTTNATVDNVAPAISYFNPPISGTYISGQNLDFIVGFSEPVNVDITNGTPYMALTVGSKPVHADYQSGSGTNSLVFRYVVAENDYDADGVGLTLGITLAGGTIKDIAGNPAFIIAGPTVVVNGVNVDAVLPTISISDPTSSSTISGSCGLYSHI